MNSWQHVKDGLPISGPNDPKLTPGAIYFAMQCEVMDQFGQEHSPVIFRFYYDESDNRFVREFDVGFPVLYWRAVE